MDAGRSGSAGSSRFPTIVPQDRLRRGVLAIGGSPRVPGPRAMNSKLVRTGQSVGRTPRSTVRGAKVPAIRARGSGANDAPIRERIGTARQAANLSRAELARRVGVRASAAAQWEQHEGTAPSVENLARLAAATGVAFEWLATGRGSMHHGAQEEAPAVVLEAFAQNLFEERLLRLGRQVPPRKREALLATLDLLLMR
jgi:transcriptional regulator with XRE-family HTH domain